jgi:hypothetical protein
MKTIRKNFSKILIGSLLTFILLLAICLFWLYNGNLTLSKEKIFKLLPFPAAYVGGHTVSVKDYLFRNTLAQKVYKNNGKPTPNNFQKTILERLVEEEKVRLIAASHGVYVSQAEINKNFNERASQGNSEEFKKTLATYGFSENYFKNQVVELDLLQNNLQVWFVKQKNLNAEAYAQIDRVEQRLSNGEDFGQLARQISQDSSSRDTAGDLGFVDPTQLVTEMREPVFAMTPGETKVIPSRYGLSLIKLQEKNGNLYHLYQIFIASSDFDTWLNNQTQAIKTINFIKI